jgi:polar amino acid transport system permease protein
MHRRSRFVSMALFGAVLALALSALTPTAFAAATPEATPSPAATAPLGTPIIVGEVPDPGGNFTLWTGLGASLNFKPNGAELGTDGKLLPNSGIDLAKCKIFINDKEQTLRAVPSISELAQGSPTIQFLWTTPKYGKGSYSFRAVVVTLGGKTLEYSWKFGSQGDANAGALIRFSVMKKWFGFIAAGGAATVELTIISIFIACIFALLGSLGRLSKKMTFKQAWERYQSWGYMWRMVLGRIPYWIATFYTSLFRGTPLLLQIIAIYQVVPEIIRTLGLPKSYNPPAFWAGVAALSLNYGAYLTEVFRAGIQAVPKGQNEAAWAIGLSPWQTQRRVILPQAFKIVIPAVGNDFIALIKDTSLVSVIAVEELLRRSQLAGAATFSFFSTLLVAAAFYWAMTIFFSFWQAKLENRMARDKAREKEKGRK